MKLFHKIILLGLILSLSFSNIFLAQGKYDKSKQTLEKGKIAIKVKEGVDPFQKQEGLVSFGINSLDQISAKYEVNKLSEMFIHKRIPKNSGLPALSRIYQIQFPEKDDPIVVAGEFSKVPNIEYAEPVPTIFLLHEPDDSLFSQQWNLVKMKAPEAWSRVR